MCHVQIFILKMYLCNSAVDIEQLLEPKWLTNNIFLASKCLVGQKIIGKPVFVQWTKDSNYLI